jgi:hypothetical protein
MDARTAKKTNASFRPDPAIAFFDALAANSSETHIMKLQKVPNVKANYLAQYVDVTGVCRIGSFDPEYHFAVYRVTPFGVMRYFFEVDTKNFKNTNSRNHYLTGSLGDIYKTILTYRKNLVWPDRLNSVFVVMEFINNLEALCERKKDTTLLLRQVVSVITGRTVVGFENRDHWNNIETRMTAGMSFLRSLTTGMKRFNDLRRWVSEMEDCGLIKFKK